MSETGHRAASYLRELQAETTDLLLITTSTLAALGLNREDTPELTAKIDRVFGLLKQQTGYREIVGKPKRKGKHHE